MFLAKPLNPVRSKAVFLNILLNIGLSISLKTLLLEFVRLLFNVNNGSELGVENLFHGHTS